MNDGTDVRGLVCAAVQRLVDDGVLGAAPGPPGRGREVVTAQDVEDAADGSLTVPRGALVTAAARDRARDLGVALRETEYGESATTGDHGALVDALVDTLSDDFSRPDLEQLAFWCLAEGSCTTPGDVRQIVHAGADRVGLAPCAAPLDDAITHLIDHTLLKPEATEDQVREMCAEAREFGFASVCVNPYYVQLVADLLAGSAVGTCTVVGFPLGSNLPEVKAAEATHAVAQGATEIDMVLNVGALKSGRTDWVRWDIEKVVEASHPRAIVKVILETALLTCDEIEAACRLARDAGADYVKTSTGFGPGGATAEDVARMRATVGRTMGVKASGGIGTRDDAARMIAAGATRIGASAGVRIARGVVEP